MVQLFTLVLAGEMLVLGFVGFLLWRLYCQLKTVRGQQADAVSAADIAGVKRMMADLAGRLTTVESDIATVPAAPRTAINLTKRGQVIRLHRRGDDSAEIASAVGLRRSEVDLIIKLQKLAVSPKASEQAV